MLVNDPGSLTIDVANESLTATGFVKRKEYRPDLVRTIRIWKLGFLVEPQAHEVFAHLWTIRVDSTAFLLDDMLAPLLIRFLQLLDCEHLTTEATFSAGAHS